MSIVNKLETELEAIEVIAIDQHTSPEQVLATVAVWVPVMVILCQIIKVFTGAKADSKIDAFMATLQIIKLFK